MGGANGHTLALTMAANMPSVLVSRGLAGGMDRDSTWVKKRRTCFGGQPEDASIFFHVRRASKSRCAIAPIFACMLCYYFPANMLRSPCRSAVSPPLKSSLVAVFMSGRSNSSSGTRGGVGRNHRAQVMIETASERVTRLGVHQIPASKLAPTMSFYARMKTCRGAHTVSTVREHL